MNPPKKICFKNISQKYKKLKRIFYEGPDWIDIPDYVAKAKYKSPTLIISLWIYAYYMRFITIPGQMIILTSLAVSLYSLVLINNPLINFSFLLIFLFFSDFIFGFMHRPYVKIKRLLPSKAKAFTPIKIDYEVKNLRNLPVWDISVDALKLKTGFIHVSAPAHAEYLAPGQTIQLSSLISSNKRGRHMIHSPIAMSTFPFGVFRWTCRQENGDPILIYPAFEPLSVMELPPGSKLQKQTFSLVSNVGESLDFHACREFCAGDNPKHIHWPSSAKKGDLIVREFREECLSRIALIVDTYVPKKNAWMELTGRDKNMSSCFESAISLAAAITEYTFRLDYIIDIFAAGDTVYHFTCGRSLAQFDDMLEILACIESSNHEPFKELEPAILEEISNIGTVILILVKWDKTREDFLNQLKEYGIYIKAILISEDAKAAKLNLPGIIRIISPEDLNNGKIKII